MAEIADTTYTRIVDQSANAHMVKKLRAKYSDIPDATEAELYQLDREEVPDATDEEYAQIVMDAYGKDWVPPLAPKPSIGKIVGSTIVGIGKEIGKDIIGPATGIAKGLVAPTMVKTAEQFPELDVVALKSRGYSPKKIQHLRQQRSLVEQELTGEALKTSSEAVSETARGAAFYASLPIAGMAGIAGKTLKLAKPLVVAAEGSAGFGSYEATQAAAEGKGADEIWKSLIHGAVLGAALGPVLHYGLGAVGKGVVKTFGGGSALLERVNPQWAERQALARASTAAARATATSEFASKFKPEYILQRFKDITDSVESMPPNPDLPADVPSKIFAQGVLDRLGMPEDAQAVERIAAIYRKWKTSNNYILGPMVDLYDVPQIPNTAESAGRPSFRTMTPEGNTPAAIQGPAVTADEGFKPPTEPVATVEGLEGAPVPAEVPFQIEGTYPENAAAIEPPFNVPPKLGQPLALEPSQAQTQAQTEALDPRQINLGQATLTPRVAEPGVLDLQPPIPEPPLPLESTAEFTGPRKEPRPIGGIESVTPPSPGAVGKAPEGAYPEAVQGRIGEQFPEFVPPTGTLTTVESVHSTKSSAQKRMLAIIKGSPDIKGKIKVVEQSDKTFNIEIDNKYLTTDVPYTPPKSSESGAKSGEVSSDLASPEGPEPSVVVAGKKIGYIQAHKELNVPIDKELTATVERINYFFNVLSAEKRQEFAMKVEKLFKFKDHGVEKTMMPVSLFEKRLPGPLQAEAARYLGMAAPSIKKGLGLIRLLNEYGYKGKVGTMGQLFPDMVVGKTDLQKLPVYLHAGGAAFRAPRPNFPDGALFIGEQQLKGAHYSDQWLKNILSNDVLIGEGGPLDNLGSNYVNSPYYHPRQRADTKLLGLDYPTAIMVHEGTHARQTFPSKTKNMHKQNLDEAFGTSKPYLDRPIEKTARASEAGQTDFWGVTDSRFKLYGYKNKAAFINAIIKAKRAGAIGFKKKGLEFFSVLAPLLAGSAQVSQPQE